LNRLCASLDKVYHDKNVAWDLDLCNASALITEPEGLEIFGNILDNAFRLCLSRVRVSSCRQPDWLEVWVDDDGPGVPTAMRERILERGQSADLRNPGQGIGLGLVTEMLEEIGGELSVESSPIGGASFRVRLPVPAAIDVG